MGELFDYVKTLRGRGLDIASRELKSRFIRGPVKTAVRRIMDSCETHGAVFTFFITGNSAIVNRAFLREILDRGHAVECHGYNHIRFDLAGEAQAKADLELAFRVYEVLFGHRMTGFRAPYLGMSNEVAGWLMDLGLAYSSSLMAGGIMAGQAVGQKPFAHACGMPEWPIAACDWHTLIRDNKGPRAFLEELQAKEAPAAVFELHPWRVGQKKYAWLLEDFLRNCTTPCVSMADLNAQGIEGVHAMALTGDLGELSIWEVLGRSLLKRNTDHADVASLLDEAALGPAKAAGGGRDG